MNRSVINNTDLSNNQTINPAVALPTLEGIDQAHCLIQKEFKDTPLFRSEGLSKLFDADVWIKDETVSPIASFKLRGALTELIRCSEQQKVDGVVTSSTGNHGLGVAYAAKLLGIPAHIFLPQNSNLFKKSRIEMLETAVYEFGNDIDDAKQAAKRFARHNGYLFVDDGESLNVMEGAGTIGLEIAQVLKNIDIVFIPMGSGTLAGGSAAAIKFLQPDAKIVAIQSKGAPAMVNSFLSRQTISHPVNTIAEGLVCREPAIFALNALLTFVDEAYLVSDAELLEGVSALAKFCDVAVEPSGAAAYAGASKLKQDIIGKRVVLVLTGANIP